MHYGWIVVWLTFIIILVAAGIRSITGVIMIPLEEEFNWTRSSISLAFAINLLIYGFAGPFVGAGLERLGVRKLISYAMLLLVFSLALSLLMTRLWHLQVIWGVMIGVGCGAFLSVLSATVANQWFIKKRGLVLGLLMAATAAGQMVFLPLLSYLTEAYSWRIGISVFIVIGVLLIPVILLWMKDKPSDKGLLPYGASVEDGIQPEAKLKSNPIKSAFEVLGIGLRSGPFWLLAISFFICGWSTIGLISTHFIPASVHHGIPEVTAASIYAFMGIFNIIGTLCSGWLSDRFDNRKLLFWYYGLRGLSLLFLPYALGSQSFLILIGFAVFYGLDWIATVPPTVRLASDYFGKQRGPIIYGWIFASHQLGASVAAFLGGYFYDVFNSYTFSIISAGVLCIIATLFVISVKKQPTIQPAASSQSA